MMVYFVVPPVFNVYNPRAEIERKEFLKTHVKESQSVLTLPCMVIN